MSTITSITRRVAVIVVGAGAAVGLTACDSDQIGAAAVVGGDRITVAELQEQAQQIIDTPGSGFDDDPDLSGLQRDILSRDILNRIMAQVADNEGIEVTDAQIDDVVNQQLDALPAESDIDAMLAEAMYTPETFRNAARSQLIAGELVGDGGDQAPLIEAIDVATEEMGVEVNPRYGEWGSNFIVEEVSGSVSVPAGGAEETEMPTDGVEQPAP